MAVRRTTYEFAVGVVVLVIVVTTLTVGLHVTVFMDDDRSYEEQIDRTYDEEAVLYYFDTVASAFNIDQPSWSVFAPEPRTTDRYYVFTGETESGELVDVYNDRPLTYERPGEELQQQYDTYRERFYMNSVRRGGVFHDNDVPVYLAEYYCDTWESEDGEELVRLNMHYVGEDITMDTIHSPEDREIQSLWEIHRHGCGDHEPAAIDPPVENDDGTEVLRSSQVEAAGA